ncbi:UNVERIFIED_CONTAM: hypothetical protein Scaly_2897200 [Sesamum calycinum]|uniref:DUF4218 domain-containing protein n=1 Tax=Sesamum calycinum TaxID=2727403 RepID=A0AAW2L6P4_9LAMI
MCNLEKVFSPAFFDSMEHLILHLPYEARVGRPLQYRWMYPFERFLHELKKKVKNNAHVEASITEAYIVEEIWWFTSHYFEPHVTCKQRQPSRNDDLTSEHERISRDIFNHPGHPSGALKKRYATGQERYMMENVESELQNIEDDLLRSLYWGPKQLVKTWPCYFVNGFNFHTEDHNVSKSTMNCGVFVKSSSYRDTENDFYGMLEEIIELDYPLNDDLHVVLFKCRWVDPTRGMKVHPHYHLVDVNFKRVYQKDEPFVLARQVVQVYYTEYPSMKRDKIDWMTVCKTKARRVESHWTNVAYRIDEEVPVPEVNTNNQTYDLHDPDGLELIVNLTSAMQHGVGTSRLDEDDEDEDDEDSFDDYETNEESEEQDNNSD